LSADRRARLCRGCRILSLDQIGYEAADLEAIRRAIHAPDGLVLVVGPSGSGRRAALYSMLEDLDPGRRSIQTIESKPLRHVPQWRQLRVASGRRCCGCRWERAWRRVLCRCAGVILIETIATAGVAQLSIQAAQAGHLVLSTMPLRGACSVIAELRRLQVTTAQLIDGLTLVIGQRLIARLCPDCSVPDERELVRRALAAALNTWLSGHAVRARRAAPKGCPQCGHAGYCGRVLAYELIEIDMHARGLIASSADPVELEHALLGDGASIWDHGLKRLADGSTSLDALQAAVRQPR
jgi:type II secretory ATPase GspE/PulE/Tfp pilus assembly ATPase PilB-like protein